MRHLIFGLTIVVATALVAPAVADFTLGGYVLPDNQVADRVYAFWGADTSWRNIQQSNGNITAPTNVMTGGLINGDPVVGTSSGSWNGQYACFFFDETPVTDGPGADIVSLPWDGNYTGEFGIAGETDKLSVALEIPGAPGFWVWRGLDGDNGGSGLWDIATFGAAFVGSTHTKVILHASAGSTMWEPGVHSNFPGPYDYDGDGDNDSVVTGASGSGNRWDSGKKQTLAAINVVPEPFTMLVLGGGLLALLKRR